MALKDRVAIEKDQTITGKTLDRMGITQVDPLTFVAQDAKAFAKTLVDRPLKIQFLTKKDFAAASMDGQIWLDGMLAQDESIPLTKRADISKGLLLDELGHNLWTKYTPSQIVAMYVNRHDQNLPTVPNLMKAIANLIEDHYIVRRLLKKYPGFLKAHWAAFDHYIESEKWVAEYRKQIAEKGYPTLDAVVAILCIAVKGDIRLNGAPAVNALADKMDSVQKLHQHEKRIKLAIELTDELVKTYMEKPEDTVEDQPELEDGQKQEQEQEPEADESESDEAGESGADEGADGEAEPAIGDGDGEWAEGEGQEPGPGTGGEDEEPEDEDWEDWEDEDEDEDEVDDDSLDDSGSEAADSDSEAEDAELDEASEQVDSDSEREVDETRKSDSTPSATESSDGEGDGEGEAEADAAEGEAEKSEPEPASDGANSNSSGGDEGSGQESRKPTVQDIYDADADLDPILQNAGLGEVEAMADTDHTREKDDTIAQTIAREYIHGSSMRVVRNPDPVNNKSKKMPQWDRQVANQVAKKMRLTAMDEGGWTHGYRSGKILPRDVVKVATGNRTPASQFNSRTMPDLSVTILQDASGSIHENMHAIICRLCDILIEGLDKAKKGIKVWHIAYEGQTLVITKEPGLPRKLNSRQASNPGGGTPTVEAIVKATEMMNREAPTSRKMIIVITDGEPNSLNIDGKWMRGNDAIHAFAQNNRDVELMQVLVHSRSGADIQHTVRVNHLTDNEISRLVTTLNETIKSTRRQRK